ncbi:MAG: DUF5702 domain-containing protein [Lachnospiraceae bacterium]|nr:DUF5702 domain-containing protein [Lachnospiraceae bacterium]
MRRRQGVITVYAGAAAVILISVILAFVESARFYVLETAAQRYAAMAAEMTFSNYVRPLADRYGIFVCPWRNDELSKMFSGYFEKNASDCGDSARLLNMYCSMEELSVSGEIAPDEDSWDYLAQQIVRAEKYALGETAAEGLMSFFGEDGTGSDLEEAANASDELAGELAEEQENLEQESAGADPSDPADGGSGGAEAGSAGAAEAPDPRKGISRLLKSGFMGFIMGDKEISAKTIDVSDCSYSVRKGSLLQLPDDFEDAGSAGSALEAEGEFWKSFLSEKEEDVLIDLYAFSNFSDMSGAKQSQEAADGGSVLQYETEYLIFGQSSDSRNLEYTMRALMAVRTGLNLVYLNQDAEKQVIVAEAASVIALAIMMPVAEELIRLLLNLCWASAEALNDCSILASGGKVPVMKDSGSWALTFEGLMQLASTGESPRGSSDGSRGLTYSQYLMILVTAVSREKLVVRMTQLMEKNVRLSEGYEGFYFKNSCMGAGFSLAAGMDPLLAGTGGKVKRKMYTWFSYITAK